MTSLAKLFNQQINLLPPTFKLLRDESQNLFGQGLTEFEFIGFQFFDDGPYISYFDRKHTIVLTPNSLLNYEQMIFQLSHETIHSLFPSGDPNANNLEEGLASYYSIYNCRNINKENWRKYLLTTNYSDQFQKVEDILSTNLNFIKDLRLRQPKLSNLTFEELKEFEPNLSDETSRFLVSRF